MPDENVFTDPVQTIIAEIHIDGDAGTLKAIVEKNVRYSPIALCGMEYR